MAENKKKWRVEYPQIPRFWNVCFSLPPPPPFITPPFSLHPPFLQLMQLLFPIFAHFAKSQYFLTTTLHQLFGILHSAPAQAYKYIFDHVYKYTFHAITETSPELRMLSTVTLYCHVTKIVMNSSSQLSEL